MPSHRRRQRAAVKARLEKMSSNSEYVYVVHYSSESFRSSDTGQSPRVTSIAVRNFSSGQTASFSIHKFAELANIPLNDVGSQYDQLEKRMLEEFYQHVRGRKDADWVHWNMRDINYGFAALEHRLAILGGTPESIEEQRKFDLSRALVTLYGRCYCEHPRIKSLMNLNSMTTMDFLTGKEEAEAFKEGLHQSTLRKVNTFCIFLESAIDGKLKTQARWHERHDLYDLAGWVKDHPLWILVGVVAAAITISSAIPGFFRSVLEFIVSLLGNDR